MFAKPPKRVLLLSVSSITILSLLFGAFFLFQGATRAASGSTGTTRTITLAGSSTFTSTAEGADIGPQSPEIANTVDDGNGGGAAGVINRSQSSGQSANGASVNSGKKAKSNPELNLSFDGLNHRNQRLANGGNQFSLEPPDQGLCAGNGFVLETINDVLRVYDTSGNALTGVVDLNTFYHYPPAINRATGVRGPFVTDPSCYYDANTQRWFHVVLTLDSFADGNFTGTNHLDLAVSQTADPRGLWNIYSLPVQDDGTQGTPNHGCSTGPARRPPTNPHACLGDYPHIGADANGFYITTNEYSFFGPEFKSAQIYAFSKSALAAGASSVAVTQFVTVGAVNGNPGFTVWPASTPGNAYETAAGGTEYFLSSDAADEANGTHVSHDLIVWALTNTQSLDTASPSLSLSNSVLTVGTYAVPPLSDQKAGNIPLGDCVNDTTTVISSLGGFTGCWKALFGAEPAHNEVESHLDSNDTRMQQVTFANGKLWGALDTGIMVNGVNKAGIEWFIVKPSVSNAGVSGKVALQGYLALANNNLTYPAIGVTTSGRGMMTFTVVGADHYPSAGYAAIDAQVGVGDIHIDAEGAGPDDGFTSYVAFAVPNPLRTRWGDYGAAVAVGNSIWIASEYIGQTCTFAQYIAAPFGSCGGTRTSLGNWDTRISKVTP